MLGNSLPAGPAQQKTENYLNYSVFFPPKNVMHEFLQKVFPGILQVIVSSGRVSRIV